MISNQNNFLLIFFKLFNILKYSNFVRKLISSTKIKNNIRDSRKFECTYTSLLSKI